jgi:DNA-binding response OmpR family regulator
MGVRGATALFFLGLFSTNTSGILLAAYSLWILNIMFPALLGLYFILKLKARSAT